MRQIPENTDLNNALERQTNAFGNRGGVREDRWERNGLPHNIYCCAFKMSIATGR